MKIRKRLTIGVLSLLCVIASALFLNSLMPKNQEVAKAETNSKYLYLSDLAVSSQSGLEGYALNKALASNDLSFPNQVVLKRGAGLVDERFSKVIVMQRSASEGILTFNISGLGATRFTAIVGINQTTSNYDSNGGDGKGKFKILDQNNNVLLQDNVLYDRYSAYGYIDLDLSSSVTQLKLVSYDDSEGAVPYCEHLVFANPMLHGANLNEGQEQSFFYLSELPYEYKDWADFYDMYAINEGFPTGGTNNPLILKTANGIVTYEKGICMQSNAKFGWDISGTNATRFTATVGINQRADLAESAAGSVVVDFRVRINGGADYSVYKTEVLRRNTNAVEVVFNIPYGASHLAIEVIDGGDGNANDNVAIADAKIYGDFVFMSDMTASSTNMGYGSLLYDDVMEGKATLYNIINEPDNSIVHRKHTFFEKNLFMHATSSADFDVFNMNANKFTAFAGIVSTKVNSDGVIFKVEAKDADGVVLAETSVTNAQDATMARISLNIPVKTKTITLSTISAIGDNNSDHGIFCMPMLFGNNLHSTKSVSVTASNDSLTVGDSEDIRVYSCAYDNTVQAITNFTLSSTNTSVVAISGKKIEAKAEGEAEVHVTFTENGIEHTTFMKVLVGSATSSAKPQLVVKSPDNKTKIVITYNNGWVDYSATQNGKLFVEKSRMGIYTSLCDFTNGLTFGSIGTQKTINETYDTYSGKFLQNTNYCNENYITFTKNGHTIKVIARAYNDGVAFRYQITSSNGSTFTISDENTSVTVPFFSNTWSSAMPTPDSTYFKAYTHEQPVTESMISSFSGAKVVPFLYKTPDGIYCLMSESDLDGTFWGSVLYSEYTKIVRIGKSVQAESSVSANGSITLPWRAFIAGDLETVIKSNMIENLAPAEVEDPSGDDWDWVEPGVSSWSWMDGVNQFWDNGGDSKNGQTVNMESINGFDYNVNWSWNSVVIGWQQNPDAIKKYIDLAADMGWKYFILDDGWQPYTAINDTRLTCTGGVDTEPIGQFANFGKWYNGVFDWMTSKSQYHKGAASGYTGEKIADYAARKGVKLIAWIHTGRIDTEARMNDVFGMLKDVGIAGIKVDFFDSESQWTIDLYNKLYEKTAEYHLLGIFHGANKPTGERRTYPNVINREAIPGEELNNTKVSQQSVLAYLRGAIGPTDLTPYIYTVGTGDTNMASQMAFSIIYESGMTCFASTAAEYIALPTDVKRYYQNFPARWADMELLSGEVGDGMTIARKEPNNNWYVGAITVEAKTETVSLDFLDSGNYTAYIYTDNPSDRRMVNCEVRAVTKNTSLTLTADDNGGFVILLEKQCSYSSEYSKDATHHWFECTDSGCDNTTQKIAHTYDQRSGQLASEATCESLATYYYSCVCGQVGTQTYTAGSLASHDFGAWQEQVDATCTTNGTKGHKHCITCGKNYDANENLITDLTIASQGNEHDYGQLQPELPAQVGVTGLEAHYQCAHCGKYFDSDYNQVEYSQLIIPALSQPISSTTSTSSNSSTSISSSSSNISSSSSSLSSTSSESSQETSSSESSSSLSSSSISSEISTETSSSENSTTEVSSESSENITSQTSSVQETVTSSSKVSTSRSRTSRSSSQEKSEKRGCGSNLQTSVYLLLPLVLIVVALVVKKSKN